MFYNYRIENRAYEEPAAILFTSATRKNGHSASLGRVVLGLPSPSPRVCTDGRMDARTLTSEPKFFGSTGYQNLLTHVAPQAPLKTSNLAYRMILGQGQIYAKMWLFMRMLAV